MTTKINSQTISNKKAFAERAQETINQINRQSMEWKTLFVRHIQDRLTFKTYKEKYISKANINKQIIQLKSGQGI